LLMASSVASRPMLRPSRPSTDARSAAVCRIAVLVLAPLLVARGDIGTLYSTIVRASLDHISTNDRASVDRVAVIRHGPREGAGYGVRPRQGQAAYDPDNVFHVNQNVEPAGEANPQPLRAMTAMCDPNTRR
jgi:hypothetical protein